LVRRNLAVALLPGTAPVWLKRVSRRESVRDAYFRLTFRRNLGWKHAVAPSPAELRRLRAAERGLAFATLTKNPYSWILSLHRRPYHNLGRPDSLHEFIETPWPTLGRERAGAAYESPVSLWNAKNRSYLALGPRAVNLTYEDVLADPAGAVARIAALVGVPWDAAGFVNMESSTKRRGRSFEEYRTYYLDELWREQLDGQAVAAINDRVDRELMARFGYAVL
jgi:hypothetical protein